MFYRNVCSRSYVYRHFVFSSASINELMCTRTPAIHPQRIKMRSDFNPTLIVLCNRYIYIYSVEALLSNAILKTQKNTQRGIYSLYNYMCLKHNVF